MKSSCPFLFSYLSKQSDFTFLLRYYTLKKWKSLSSCSQYLFLSLSLSFAMPSFTTIFIFLFVPHVPQCVIFLIFWIINWKSWELLVSPQLNFCTTVCRKARAKEIHWYFNQSQHRSIQNSFVISGNIFLKIFFKLFDFIMNLCRNKTQIASSLQGYRKEFENKSCLDFAKIKPN